MKPKNTIYLVVEVIPQTEYTEGEYFSSARPAKEIETAFINDKKAAEAYTKIMNALVNVKIPGDIEGNEENHYFEIEEIKEDNRNGKISLYATNIDWDVDVEELKDRLSMMPDQEAARFMGMSAEEYIFMKDVDPTMEMIYDVLTLRLRDRLVDLKECMGLPYEVRLPEEFSDQEDIGRIVDYLSDRFGFLINGFSVQKKSVPDFDMPTYDELLRMFTSYVDNDYEGAMDLSYVQTALETIGCTKEIASAIGLDWVWPEE